MTSRNRNRVLLATGVVWCLSVLAFETFRVWKVLSSPPQLEEYVNHLDFQLFASAFLVITRWLPLLGGLSLLYFARLTRAMDRRSLALWTLFSAAALATHYFAAFLVLAAPAPTDEAPKGPPPQVVTISVQNDGKPVVTLVHMRQVPEERGSRSAFRSARSRGWSRPAGKT